ncbi:MAG: PaaI family thioesterase [Chloroflexi bacterium]|nr:PaaI family thioesterase [Chloroflexota bacterium]
MTDSTEQLSLNDVTDYGLCFACGPRSPYGLKLHMEREGDRVVAKFTAMDEYQGFPGYLHGGITTALLDEVMSRVSIITHNRWSITAGIDIQFRKPVFIGQEVTATAEHVETNMRMVTAKAELMLPDGTAAARATGKFFFVTDERLADMTSDFPGLRRDWMR